MKISLRKYPQSDCWKFNFSTFKAWKGKLLYLNFHRYSLIFDFRKNWINDMVNKND